METFDEFVRTEKTLIQVTERKENGKYLCIDLTDMSEEWLSKEAINNDLVADNYDIEELFDLVYIVYKNAPFNMRYEYMEVMRYNLFHRKQLNMKLVKVYGVIFTDEGIKTVAEYKNGGWVRKDQVELW